MTIWRMRIAWVIPEATDTHSEYVILGYLLKRLYVSEWHRWKTEGGRDETPNEVLHSSHCLSNIVTDDQIEVDKMGDTECW